MSTTADDSPVAPANAEAIELTMDLGPAGEILRLQGERAAHLHEPIRQALREGMAEFSTPAAWSRPPRRGW